MGKFSSISVFKSMIKNNKWTLKDEGIFTPSMGNRIRKTKGNENTRQQQKWWSFEYIGE
jgi:hypothetical protein